MYLDSLSVPHLHLDPTFCVEVLIFFLSSPNFLSSGVSEKVRLAGQLDVVCRKILLFVLFILFLFLEMSLLFETPLTEIIVLM